MIKKVICTIGGIISIISTFLPVFIITYVRTYANLTKKKFTIYYWMFGQIIFQEKGESAVFRFRYIDLLGTTCMMIIIVGAMLVIMNGGDNSKEGLIRGLIGGLLVIIAMISYAEVINSYMFYYYTSETIRNIMWSADKVQFTLSYGYYGALIGGITSIVGSILPKKKLSYDGE